MSQQESRPPEFPRPSSTVAKNRLKSRLTFTSGKPQSASSALPKPRMQAGSQFSGKFIASNYGSRPPEVNASAWLEPADDQSTHTAPADEELDLLSVVLGGSEDKRISGQSSVFDSQIGVAGTVGHNSSFTSHNLLQKSHANMSSVLESEGHEHVVNSMVTGEAEFCYVDVDSENPFKFGITNVPKEIRENRFSTLSKNGLLRRLKDGDVEHVPLDRFIREHELYNKLMELTIFKQYRLWKCFSIWNRNIKQHKFMRYKQELEPKLIYLDPTLKRLRSRTIEYCLDIQQMSVLKFETHRVYDILEFAEAQKAVHDDVVATRNKMRVDLIEDLSKAGELYVCQDCENMPETVPRNSINTYSGRKNSTYKSKSTADAATPGAVATVSSADKILSFTERAKIRSKCRFLWNILRSFDFMIRDALYSSAEASMQKLRNSMDLASNKKVVVEEGGPAPPVTRGNSSRLPQTKVVQPKGPRKPITMVSVRPADGIFRLNIVLNGTQMRVGEEVVNSFALGIEPIKEHLVRTFHDSLKYSIETGVYTHSLLLAHEFEALLFPISTSETRDCTLEDLVYSNKHNTLHLANNECIQLFCKDLDGCIQETLKYSHFAEKYTYNTAYYRRIQGMSARIRQNMPNAINDFVPDVIAENMVRLTEEVRAASEIPNTIDIGCFRVELMKLQSNINTQTSSCLSSLHSLTPQVFLSEGSKLYHDVYSLRAELLAQPNTLEDFVRLLVRYRAAVLDRDRLALQFEYINDIKDVINNQEVALSDEASRQHLSLSNVWSQYNEVMESFNGSIESNTKNFTRDLKSKVKMLQEPIENAKTRLNSDLLKNPEYEPSVVLHEIELLQLEFDSIYGRCMEIEHCQEVMQVVCFNSIIVLDMIRELKAHKVIWQIVEVLNNLHSAFMSNESFLAVDCEAVEDSIRVCLKKIIFEVEHENAAVRGWIDNRIGELQLWVPIIKHLQSPTLQDRHIKGIHTAAGAVLLKTSDAFQQPSLYSVGMLLEMNLHDSAEVIATIFHESVCEYQLEFKINECLKKLSVLEFEVHADRENKAMFYIANIDDILRSCEDFEITLSSALKSSFVSPHWDLCQNSLDKVQRYCNALCWMQSIQSDYSRFRILFTSTRTARYLGAAMKHYKIVDDLWRNVLKIAKNEYLVSSVCDNEDLVQQCKVACVEAELTLQKITTFVMEQCQRWPKLFMCSTQQILEFLTIQEPNKCYALCRHHLLPRTTGLLFDETDNGEDGSDKHGSYSSGTTGEAAINMKIIGVISHLESLRFRGVTVVSYKSGFVDWIRSMENAVSDRVASDLKDNTTPGKWSVESDIALLTEDRQAFGTVDLDKKVLCLNQNRLSLIEIKFWKAVEESLKSDARRGALDPVLDEVMDHIGNYSDFLSVCAGAYGAPSSAAAAGGIKLNSGGDEKIAHKYHYYTAANALLVLMQQRDLVSDLLDDVEEFDTDLTFALHCAIKKQWNSSTNSLVVSQGHLQLGYGYKYQGCFDKIIVTPLTDKCMLALSIGFQNHAIPFICSTRGGGKSSMTRALCDALGSDMISVDCADCYGYTNASILEYLHASIRASVSCQLWLNITNVEALPHHIFCCLLTQLSVVRSSIIAGAAHTNIGAAVVDLRSSTSLLNTHQLQHNQVVKLKARFSLCYNIDSSGLNSADCYLPPIARKQFRPLFYVSPDYKVLMEILLRSLNFVFPSVIASRLECVCEHLVRFVHVPNSIVDKQVVASIRHVGISLNASMDVITQTSLVVKHLMCQIHPIMIAEHLENGSNLRDLANTYMEMIFLKELDLETFSYDTFHAHESANKYRAIGWKSVHVAIDSFNPKKGGISEKGLNLQRSYGSIKQAYDALMSCRHVVVYGTENCGKSTVINHSVYAFISDFNATISKMSDLYPRNIPKFPWKVELHPVVVNPLLLIPPISIKKAKQRDVCYGCEFMSENDCYNCPDGVISLMLRIMDGVIQKVDTDSSNMARLMIVEFSASSKYLSSFIEWTVMRTKELNKRIVFVWECSDVSHVSPNVLCGPDVAFVGVSKPFKAAAENSTEVRNRQFISQRMQLVDDLITEFRCSLNSRISDSKRGLAFKKLFFECIQQYVVPCLSYFDVNREKLIKSVEDLFCNAVCLAWKLIVYYVKKSTSYLHSNTSSLCPNPASLHFVQPITESAAASDENAAQEPNHLQSLQNFESPMNSPIKVARRSSATPGSAAHSRRLMAINDEIRSSPGGPRGVGAVNESGSVMFDELDSDVVNDFTVFDDDSIRVLFIYSSIWTFGACDSANGNMEFQKWFGSYFNKHRNVREVHEGQGESHGAPLPLFPPFDDIYSAYVLRPEEGSTILKWIPFVSMWKNREFKDNNAVDSSGGAVGDERAAENVLAMAVPVDNMKIVGHSFSTQFYSASMHSIIVPTAVMQNGRIIQKALSFCSTVNESLPIPVRPTSAPSVPRKMEALLELSISKLDCRRNNNILICGENGSGKSSLMYSMVCDNFTHHNRWVCYISDEIRKGWSRRSCTSKYGLELQLPHKICSGINDAKVSVRPSMIENNWMDCGSLFVDDVNLPTHAGEVGSQGCLELLRFLVEHRNIFNFERNSYEKMDNTLSVLAATTNGPCSRVCNSFVKYPHLLCTNPAIIQQVFTTKCIHSCPFIKELLCNDLMVLTCNSLKYFMKSMVLFQTTRVTTTEAEIKDDDSSEAEVTIEAGPIKEFAFQSKPFIDGASNSVCDTKMLSPCLGGLLLVKSLGDILEHIRKSLKVAADAFAVVTANEVLRIWDRCLSSFCENSPEAEKMWERSIEDALHDYANYAYPQFCDTYLRTLRKRTDMKQKFIASGMKKNREYSSEDDSGKAKSMYGEAKLFIGSLNMEQLQDRYWNEVYQNSQDSASKSYVQIKNKLDDVLEKEMLHDPHFWIDMQGLSCLCSVPNEPLCLFAICDDDNATNSRLAASAVIRASCVSMRCKYELWNDIEEMIVSARTGDACADDLNSATQTLMMQLSDRILKNFSVEQSEIKSITRRASAVDSGAGAKFRVSLVPAESNLDSNDGLQISVDDEAKTDDATDREVAEMGGEGTPPIGYENTVNAPTVWHIPLNIGGLLNSLDGNEQKNVCDRESLVISFIDSLLLSVQNILLAAVPSLSHLLSDGADGDLCSSPYTDSSARNVLGEYLSRQKFVFVLSTGPGCGDTNGVLSGLGIALLNVAASAPCVHPKFHILHLSLNKYSHTAVKLYAENELASVSLKNKIADTLNDIGVVLSSTLCFTKFDCSENFAAVYSPSLASLVSTSHFFDNAVAFSTRFSGFIREHGLKWWREESTDHKAAESVDPDVLKENVIGDSVICAVFSRYLVLLSTDDARRACFDKICNCLEAKQWQLLMACTSGTYNQLHAHVSKVVKKLLTLAEIVLDRQVEGKLMELFEKEAEMNMDEEEGEEKPQQLGDEAESLDSFRQRKKKTLDLFRIKATKQLPFYHHECVKRLFYLADILNRISGSKAAFSRYLMEIAINIYVHGCVKLIDTSGGILPLLLCEIFRHFSSQFYADDSDILHHCLVPTGEDISFSKAAKDEFYESGLYRGDMDPYNNGNGSTTVKNCFVVYVAPRNIRSSWSFAEIAKTSDVVHTAILCSSFESRLLMTNTFMVYQLVVLLNENVKSQKVDVEKSEAVHVRHDVESAFTNRPNNSKKFHDSLTKNWVKCCRFYKNHPDMGDVTEPVEFNSACIELDNDYFSHPNLSLLYARRVHCLLILLSSVCKVMKHEFAQLMWNQFVTTSFLLLKLPLSSASTASTVHSQTSTIPVRPSRRPQYKKEGFVAPKASAIMVSEEFVHANLEPLPIYDNLSVSTVLTLDLLHSLVSREEYNSILLQMVMYNDVLDTDAGHALMGNMLSILHEAFSSVGGNVVRTEGKIEPTGSGALKSVALEGFRSGLHCCDVSSEEYIGHGEKYVNAQMNYLKAAVESASAHDATVTVPPLAKVSDSAALLLEKLWKLCLVYGHSLHRSDAASWKHHSDLSADNIVRKQLHHLLGGEDKVAQCLIWVAHLDHHHLRHQVHHRHHENNSQIIHGMPIWEYWDDEPFDNEGSSHSEHVRSDGHKNLLNIQKLLLTIVFKPFEFGDILSSSLVELGYRLPHGSMSLTYISRKLQEVVLADRNAQLSHRISSLTPGAGLENSSVTIIRDIEGVALDNVEYHCYTDSSNPGAAVSYGTTPAFDDFHTLPIVFLCNLDFHRLQNECSLMPHMERILASNAILESYKGTSGGSSAPTAPAPVGQPQRQGRKMVTQEPNAVQCDSGNMLNLAVVHLSRFYSKQFVAANCESVSSSQSSMKDYIVQAINSKCESLSKMYTAAPIASNFGDAKKTCTFGLNLFMHTTDLLVVEDGNQHSNGNAYAIGNSCDVYCSLSRRQHLLLQNYSDFNGKEFAPSLMLVDSISQAESNIDDTSKRSSSSKEIGIVEYDPQLSGIWTDTEVEAFMRIFRHSLMVLKDLRVKCSNEFSLVSIRMRWLLALFHASVVVRTCNNENYGTAGISNKFMSYILNKTKNSATSSLAPYESVSVTPDNFIGDDTLVYAAECMDTLLNCNTRSFGSSVPDEPGSSPKKPAAQAPSFGSIQEDAPDYDDVVEGSTINPALAAAAAAAVLNVEYGSTEAGDALTAALNNVEQLLGYIADCVYGNCVACKPASIDSIGRGGGSIIYNPHTADQSRNIIKSCFALFFTPGCCSPVEPYYLQGHLEMPMSLTDGSINKFCEDLVAALDHTFGYYELIGCNVGEIHQRVSLNVIRPALSRLNPRFPKQSTLIALGNRTPPSSGSIPVGLCGASTTLTTFSRLNDVIAAVTHIREQFLSFLIDMNTSEWKDRTRLKGSKVVTNAGKLPIVAKGRSRRGNTTNIKGMKPTTRECDPMWTYFLMECKYGNMVIQHYVDNMQAIIDALSTYDWRVLQATNVAYTTNSSRISREAMLINLVALVLQGYVPHCWLSSTASSGTFFGNYASQGVVVTISMWLEEFRLKKLMFDAWFKMGHPNSSLQLPYLMNPHGIFQALIEYFAWKNGSKLDGLFIDARILEMTDGKQREYSEYGPLEPPPEEAVLAAESQLNKDQNGCSLVLRGVKMSNAQWNGHKYSLEFTSRCSTLVTADQDVNLRITVSPNKADTSEEDYNCPLYVNPSFVNNIAAKTGLDSLPVCYESMQVNSINANSRKLRHSSFMATNETLVKRSNFPMLYVTIPSMENIEECACKNVILTSSR